MTVRDSLDELARRFPRDSTDVADVDVQFDIDGSDGGVWHARIANGTCAVADGPAREPQLTLQLSSSDWLDMVAGRKSSQMLFMIGRLKVKGDIGLAIKLVSLLKL
jgi:putative sterol carrier protein